MIILDTNVLSELLKPTPSSEVIAWLSDQASLQLFTTTITQAEILYGVELLPRGKRKSRLELLVAAVLDQDFEARILGFDTEAARAFAKIVATRRTAGRPIAAFDAQIAAIAQSRNAAVATRNIGDFEGCGIRLVNPWREC
jgi:hypothetical protein